MTASPEYRRCPVSGRWVIVAPERAARPLALSHARPTERAVVERDVCPFCPGHEGETPPPVHVVSGPDGWTLRVVPNKFPAVRDLPLDTTSPDRMPAFGVHEVLIECRRHESDPARLTADELSAVFAAYRDRIRALSAVPGIGYVTAFKNVGAEAGASLAHLHSQLLATPMVPDAIAAELAHVAAADRDPFADMLASPARLVARSERFALACPFAPRFAYETWLLPTRPEPRFETVTDAECDELAGLLWGHLRALDEVVGPVAYNWFLHTAPVRGGPWPWFRWHVEIIPRTARAAGFEWATGCFINPTPPERAAGDLRFGRGSDRSGSPLPLGERGWG